MKRPVVVRMLASDVVSIPGLDHRFGQRPSHGSGSYDGITGWKPASARVVDTPGRTDRGWTPRFGTLPPQVEAHLEQLKSPEQLEACLEAVAVARDPEEVERSLDLTGPKQDP